MTKQKQTKAKPTEAKIATKVEPKAKPANGKAKTAAPADSIDIFALTKRTKLTVGQVANALRGLAAAKKIEHKVRTPWSFPKASVPRVLKLIEAATATEAK